MKEHFGQLKAESASIAVVAGRFNETITRGLLQGVYEGARRYGMAAEDLEVYWVPGAFEIPLLAKKLAETSRFDAVITLGAVIRGETTHFDYVAGPAASGIAQVALETGIPCIFGVLTLESIEQGLARSGGTAGNKGFEAFQTAIEMIDLCRQVSPCPA